MVVTIKDSVVERMEAENQGEPANQDGDASLVSFMAVVLAALLIPRLYDTTGCQTGLATGMTTGCIVQNKHPTGCQTNRFDNRVE